MTLKREEAEPGMNVCLHVILKPKAEPQRAFSWQPAAASDNM